MKYLKNIEHYLNEKKSNVIYSSKDYKKSLKIISGFIDFEYRLNLNIDYYFKIYNVLFKNSEYKLDNYSINLLIISSFSRMMNVNKSKIDELKDEIRKNNIYEYYNSSFLILDNIYKLLLIIKKSVKDKDILFNNRFILDNIYYYLYNKKINIYDFNSLFSNNLKSELIEFVKNNH